MPRERFKNTSASTLASGIDDSQTSFDVASGGVFPSSGQFRIRIDDEVLLCTSRSSDTLTVVRGVESSTPATHDSAAACTHVGTAGGFAQFGRDNVAFYDDPSQPLINSLTGADGSKLVLSDFTWVNQEGASASNYSSGGIYIEAPANDGRDIRALVRSAPSTPYVVTAGFRCLLPSATSDVPSVGLVFRESSSGELYYLAASKDNLSWKLYVFKMNGPTSQHSVLLNGSPFEVVSDMIWFQLEDNGANLLFSLSFDGIHFVQVASEGRTSLMSAGPDQIGFAVENLNNTAHAIQAGLLQWSEG